MDWRKVNCQKIFLESFFKQFDLILLTETWTNEKDALELEGFTICNYPRKNKHVNAKRDSGGIGVFIRDSIRSGVVLGKNRHGVIAWMTLKSDCFGFKNDLHVTNICIVPQGSVHMREDVFALSYEDVAHIPSHAKNLTVWRLQCPYKYTVGLWYRKHGWQWWKSCQFAPWRRA